MNEISGDIAIRTANPLSFEARPGGADGCGVGQFGMDRHRPATRRAHFALKVHLC